MVSASTKKVVLGTVAFAFFWFLAVFPSIPFLPIGRTAGSLLGAMLMVVFQILTPDEAYSAIDLPILGLLFGTMVVSIYLERADMFKYLAKFLSYKSRGPKDLLCRVCVVSAISSALFTNDTSCVVLTEFVLKIARQNNLPPQPFLLALATSANIGSSSTPIGNPQNLVIAVQSRISFGRFLKGLLPAMVVGVAANMGFLLVYYWRVLSIDKAGELEDANVDEISEGDAASHRFSPARLSWVVSVNSSSDESFKTAHGDAEDRGSSNDRSSVVEIGDGIVRSEEGVIARMNANCYSPSVSVEGKALSGASEESNSEKRLWWKILVYLVTVGMLIALLMGLNMSWTAIAAALALMVLDFKDACPCLEKVSYALLVFFCGMFITIDGFNETSLPSSLWNFLEPYSRIDRASGVAVLALVILLLSNVASNVPTVLLLGARVAASAASISQEEVTKAWFILAWVSTVAGNLSLLGSAANLIVCEQAQRAKLVGYTLSFWNHLRFGLPSTLLVTAIGLLLIRG